MPTSLVLRMFSNGTTRRGRNSSRPLGTLGEKAERTQERCLCSKMVWRSNHTSSTRNRHSTRRRSNSQERMSPPHTTSIRPSSGTRPRRHTLRRRTTRGHYIRTVSGRFCRCSNRGSMRSFFRKSAQIRTHMSSSTSTKNSKDRSRRERRSCKPRSEARGSHGTRRGQTRTFRPWKAATNSSFL